MGAKYKVTRVIVPSTATYYEVILQSYYPMLVVFSGLPTILT